MEPTRKRPTTRRAKGSTAPGTEADQGYGASHGYGPGHGGPSGPGDVPGNDSAPSHARKVTPRDEAEPGDGEPARPSETGPGQG